jgi:integrase/recombinase XerD
MTANGPERTLAQTKILPVPKWAHTWYDLQVAKGLSPLSLKRYRSDLRLINLNLLTASVEQIRHRQAEIAAQYSKPVQRHVAVIARSLLRELGRDEDALRTPLPQKPNSRVVVYSQDDIERILKNCNTIRDRLLVEVLLGTGARRGELYNMRIKDVQFDEYSPIIWLNGKTGIRKRRLFNATSDLVAYLSVHPDKNNPEAKFWLNQYGRPLSYGGFWRTIHRIGQRALKRYIFPHGFRHTAATLDAKKFTDRELMLRYGWDSAEMVGVYAHLSARDLDEKELFLQGLTGHRTCTKCHASVNSRARFCENCGQALGPQLILERWR